MANRSVTTMSSTTTISSWRRPDKLDGGNLQRTVLFVSSQQLEYLFGEKVGDNNVFDDDDFVVATSLSLLARSLQ